MFNAKSNYGRDGAAVGEYKMTLALGTNAMKALREGMVAAGDKLQLAANPSGGKPRSAGVRR